MFSFAMPGQRSPLFPFILIAAASVHCTPVAWTHPLQAEPINHPYVFTFDQFNLAEDPPEHLVGGGLLLIAELRCASCHEAPAAWASVVAPAPGPLLAGVGSRLDEDTLWLLVRSPQHRKRGTLMPALFSNEEGDDIKVEAITAYLASLKAPTPDFPKGDPLTGKRLYHEVGCIACHQPATDVPPPGTEANAEFERPGNASVPIALADSWELQSLGQFLFDPLSLRPAARMPAQRLSRQEAADIASYLHIERKIEIAAERKLLALPRQSIELGAAIFAKERCDNCHSSDPNTHHPALPMSKLQLDTATNCLAEYPAPGAPRFGLNELQRRALSLALKAVQTTAPQPRNHAEQADWAMTRLNCYACHDRDGKGGPEDPRAAYFAVPGANDGLPQLPPTLDGIGSKLTSEQLQNYLWHGSTPGNSTLKVRMPVFGEAATSSLINHLLQADNVAK